MEHMRERNFIGVSNVSGIVNNNLD